MHPEPPFSYAIATRNRNSNFVRALLCRLPPGRYNHAFVEGLREFGIPLLFGIEPRVTLIAIAARDLTFARREANFNSPVIRGLSLEENEKRFLQYLRSLGHDVD